MSAVKVALSSCYVVQGSAAPSVMSLASRSRTSFWGIRSDVARVDSKVDATKQELRAEMRSLRADVAAEMHSLRADVAADFYHDAQRHK